MSNVNRPAHYNQFPVECIDIAELLNFNQGNAFKYVWRAHEKGKATEDMQKAVFYLEREIARETPFAAMDDDVHLDVTEKIMSCGFPGWQMCILGEIVNYTNTARVTYLHEAKRRILERLGK